MAAPGNVMTFPGSEESNVEALLLNKLRVIERDSSGCYAVQLHLSGLRPGNRKPHFLGIAARTFDNLETNFEATLFQLYNGDFVVICKDVPVDEIDPVIFKVRQLFSEDPLTDGEDGSLEDRFSTWYDFSDQGDYASFVEVANEIAVQAAAQRKKEADLLSPNSLPGERLNPESTTQINLKLQSVEILDLIQEQTAVVVKPGAKGSVLFNEQYVSMAALQKRVSPDVNLFGSNWLFQFLTETIDRRLLGVMSRRNFAALKEPISLNLNISTVLGREFQHFHHVVGGNAGKVVVELQLIDILSDMAAFYDARDMLQENGYRVLLDGMSPLALQFFDPAILEVDLIKISWGQEFESEESDERVKDMRKVIGNVGKDSVIISRVDSEKAVVWALALGITRFQGYYIDTVVEAMLTKGII